MKRILQFLVVVVLFVLLGFVPGGYAQEVFFEDINFDSNSSSLTPDARWNLNKIGEWLIDNPLVNIILEGHSDIRGTKKYNLWLAERRVGGVKDYLITRGIVQDRLGTKIYGDEKPLCMEDDETCWRQNRRVHIIPVRQDIVNQHRKIFLELGLSKHTANEVAFAVAMVYDNIQKQKAINPDWDKMMDKVLRGSPKNLEEAVARHKNRFKKLGVSERAQEELTDAFTLVYTKLHSGGKPDEMALKIKAMMKQLPPCCDDAIFERAGVKQEERAEVKERDEVKKGAEWYNFIPYKK
ncbi:MAG: OmpA family protein [Nitrospinae bacterium]|nr:OmpA family protein [Nitrospinota bacterium]